MTSLYDYLHPPQRRAVLIIHRRTREYAVGMGGKTTSENYRRALAELRTKLVAVGAMRAEEPFQLDMLDIQEKSDDT